MAAHTHKANVNQLFLGPYIYSLGVPITGVCPFLCLPLAESSRLIHYLRSSVMCTLFDPLMYTLRRIVSQANKMGHFVLLQ